MAKRVEGLWIVQGIHLDSSGKEYEFKPRVVTTKQGLKMAIAAENKSWTGAIRIHITEYNLTEIKKETIQCQSD